MFVMFMLVFLLYTSLVGVQVELRGAQGGILEEARWALDAKRLALEGHSRQRRCVSRTKQHEASCAQGMSSISSAWSSHQEGGGGGRWWEGRDLEVTEALLPLNPHTLLVAQHCEG